MLLFIGAPMLAIVLLAVKVSHVLEMEWLLVVIPPIAVAIYGLLARGAAELSWKWHCQSTLAARTAAEEAARRSSPPVDRSSQHV